MSSPVNFLDLPPEVRIMIYTHLFTNWRLQIDLPRRFHGRENGIITPQSTSKGASLPVILLTNKSIRSEALPVFAKLLTPEFHHPGWVDYPRQCPAHYLQYAECAFVFGRESSEVDRDAMPRLKHLTIYYGSSLFEENESEPLQCGNAAAEIVRQARSNVGWGRDPFDDGCHMPFKVVVHVDEVEMRCWEHYKTLKWKNIVVDWNDGKVLSGGEMKCGRRKVKWRE